MSRPARPSVSKTQRDVDRHVSEPVQVEDGVTLIDPAGDLILDFSSEHLNEQTSFRINSEVLSSHSKYFWTLLCDDRFQEGNAVIRRLDELKHKVAISNVTPETISVVELPRVRITDVGQISQVKTVRPLIRDFLLMMHDSRLAPKKMPLSNLANLAIVADRFDAGARIGRYVSKAGLLTHAKTSNPLRPSEEAVRQKLLSASIFDMEEIASAASADLIVLGSATRNRTTDYMSLWWDLPRGIEGMKPEAEICARTNRISEEIESRRCRILESISSLQAFVLDQYTNGTRQCRLGYDTSPACDSFQLGEFVRFLKRTGALRFGSSFSQVDNTDLYDGDLEVLLQTLRQCPTYQIDPNHSHCGPKKRFVSGLNAIQTLMSRTGIAICFHCWNQGGFARASWAEAKQIPISNLNDDLRAATQRGFRHSHGQIGTRELPRDFFNAVERLWTLPDMTGALK